MEDGHEEESDNVNNRPNVLQQQQQQQQYAQCTNHRVTAIFKIVWRVMKNTVSIYFT